MSDVFPVAKSTLPYWRTELHEIDSHRSTDQLPEECDVLIVGAGISGVSTAYHLLNNNPSPPSIVLLEAREVCSGATGRNGDFSLSLFKYNLLKIPGGHLMMVWSYIDRIRKEYGEDAAKELALFQAKQVYAMKEVVWREKLDCDLLLTRVCEAYISQEQADEMTAMYQKLLDDRLDYIQDVDCVGAKYAERVSVLPENLYFKSNTES
jgi:cation diffusion facilitator CzcD-associated flavoprotein CzcO